MKINELLADLKRKFPNSPIEGWDREFRAVLGASEGERLRQAYESTMRAWTDFGAPKPAQIAANFPAAEKGSFQAELGKRDYARIERVQSRADQLYATALAECATWLTEEWAECATWHLRNVTRRIAELEERGEPLSVALARINGHDSRPGYDLRPPAVWLDESDAAIFKARWESWKRVNPNGGMKRGDTDPPWRLRRAEIREQRATEADIELAKRRAAINARITHAI